MLHQGRTGMPFLDQQPELLIIIVSGRRLTVHQPARHCCTYAYCYRNLKPALSWKVLPMLTLGGPTLSLSSRLIAMSLWIALPHSQSTSKPSGGC